MSAEKKDDIAARFVGLDQEQLLAIAPFMVALENAVGDAAAGLFPSEVDADWKSAADSGLLSVYAFLRKHSYLKRDASAEVMALLTKLGGTKSKA